LCAIFTYPTLVIQVVLFRAGVPSGPDLQPVLDGGPSRELRIPVSGLQACRLNAVPPLPSQIFKIVAPFVFLSATFATLNARLGMPPFALFLVALCLTDGALYPCLHIPSLGYPRQTVLTPTSLFPAVMTMTFFFNVTDTGKGDHQHITRHS
jgi:hypothetical protein